MQNIFREAKAWTIRMRQPNRLMPGEVVVFGTRIGIAGTTIPVGSTGSIHMVGVFKIPKKDGEAIEKGAIVYYSEDGLTAIAAEEQSVPVAGYAVDTSVAASKTVTVKLIG